MLDSQNQQMPATGMLGYRLTFPTPLDVKQVGTVMRIIAGRFYGSPAVGFEVWSKAVGFIHRLVVPRVEAGFIVPQLRTAIPGINVTPEHQPPDHIWSCIVELGDASRGRTFSAASPEAVASTILASLQVRADEVLLWQVVVAPPLRPYVAPKDQKPPRTSSTVVNLMLDHLATSKEEIADRRAKLTTPNVDAVLRLAVRAATPARTAQLLRNVESALGALRGDNEFRRLTPHPEDQLGLLDRLASAHPVYPAPSQLSEAELTSVVAWPIGEPAVAGLPQGRARHLVASPAVARAGVVVADSNVPGRERPIALTKAGMTMHTAIMGPTGTGKTVGAANIFAQFISDGGGALVIETKGERNDLFHKALNYIPKHRIKDVILIDVADTQWPVGFNILQQGHPQSVASGLETLFEEIYGSFGVRMPAALYHGLMVFMTTKNAQQPMTFADLPILYAPRTEGERALADRLVAGTPDPEIRRWWQLLGSQYPTLEKRNAFFEPINQRLWQINGRPELRNIFGQSQSSFDLYRAVASNKIILVNLAGFGQKLKNLLGAILIDLFWSVIKGRAARQPYAIFLDELQNAPTLSMDIGNEMLCEGRAFNLCAVLGSQGLSQLAPRVADLVMVNCRNKLVFQTDSSNARAFMREFGKSVSEDDLVNLGKYEAIGRVVGDAGVSPPMTMLMRSPFPSSGLAYAVRLHSRQTYSREVATVEAEIRARRGGRDDRPTTRPLVGETDW